MTMIDSSRGQRLFQEHMNLLTSQGLEQLLRRQYTQDAILISTFDILDVPPPHIVHAGPEMIRFFSRWLDYHGPMTVDSLYNFAVLEDSIAFHALITSQTGTWVLGEAWHMRGELIDRHYGFCHRISDPA
jgi:hypothetical protein